MYLHQIFLSIEDSRFEDFPTYAENAALLRAMNPDVDYWLWTDDDVEALIELRYPHLLGFVARFPHRFYLVDFARYLILDTYGGIYVDLDERPLRSLPADLGVVIGNCEYKGNRRLAGEYPANNNIVKLLPASYPLLIAYAQQEFERVSRMDVYRVRKGRAFKQSVGVLMFARFCRQHGLRTSLPTHEYFHNQNGRAWECLVSSRGCHFKGAAERSRGRGVGRGVVAPASRGVAAAHPGMDEHVLLASEFA